MDYKTTLNDLVFIKLDKENDSIRLKNGCELYVDCAFEPEKNASVTGTVYGVPSHLHYTGKVNIGMPWLCDMEVNYGDKVILYYLSVINALKPQNKKYIIEGKDRYIFVNYSSIYAVYGDNFVKPINGYCLIAPVEDPSITAEKERMKKIGMELIVGAKRNSKDVIYGKVKYLGKPNREYADKEQSDTGIDISIGDIVVIRKTADIPLQYELHQQVNDGKKLYRVQRKNIFAKM
jgi:hypothetical protein